MEFPSPWRTALPLFRLLASLAGCAIGAARAGQEPAAIPPPPNAQATASTAMQPAMQAALPLAAQQPAMPAALQAALASGDASTVPLAVVMAAARAEVAARIARTGAGLQAPAQGAQAGRGGQAAAPGPQSADAMQMAGQSGQAGAQRAAIGAAPGSALTTPAALAGLRTMLERLDHGDFSTTWSGCTTVKRIDCSGDAAYMAEFGAPAAQVRSALRALDAAGLPLFARPGHELEKLLVLLGDKYRETVRYPINKSANRRDFFRAYYSDAAVFIHRGHTAVAQNLGNFSAMSAADTPSVRHTVITPRPAGGGKEYLTGLYVVPGKTVTLTRSGNGGGVRFGLNMLRDTTWVFNTYDRPTHIASPRAPLPPEQPVTITSPFGGPLLLFIDAAPGDDGPVTVQVDGAITHPVLRDAGDPAAVAAFQAVVDTTPTNWVGFATDTLTVHSTLGHFRKTMAAYQGDMAALAADTYTYMVRDTYQLAGFHSASGQLRLADGAAAFCREQGWDCSGPQHRRDIMQHVISDVHALCGAGCSGNPYDENWPFTPLGWGESHEIGHGIQPARLKIHGAQSAEVSNNIFPMHKQMRYNASPAGQAAPIAARPGAGLAAFNVLKTARRAADPVAAMYASAWADTGYAANNSVRVMFYRQLAEYARHYNRRFDDGWELYPLLYLLDRNLPAAATNWPAMAARYGFGAYASYPAAIDGNDFMLIATSFIIGRDMGPMFALWGVTASAAARAQVAAYGYAPVQPLYFPMPDLATPPARVGPPLEVTADASYPAGY